MVSNQALRVWPPMDPQSRLEAAAKVLQLENVEKTVAALTAEWIISMLLEPKVTGRTTPATLVNFLVPRIWTYHRDLAAEAQDATTFIYNNCERVAAAVSCIYRDYSY